ncbi:MAG TPA: cupin domain-containing protein [Acidimicrobiales bacterium]|nr:cupin domain-containing protein [Acidimicrobiales bacterium]
MRVKTLEEFDRELADAHMRGQWQYDRLLEQVIGGPRPAGVPHVWKWDDVEPYLREALDVLPETYTARRHLSFINPALDRGTTHTIHMGLQMLQPGEVSWAHRHTLAALRFVVKGHANLTTVVDGENCPMEDYDLVLTPQWTWHDHHNDDPTANAVWLDVLDLGIVLGLNSPFYEPYGEERQPPRPKPSDYLQARTGLVRPVWEQRKTAHLPIRYPWREIEPLVMAMADRDGSPYDGIALEYVNPMTGGPTFPTMTCWVQMLRPGEATEAHRHTSAAVYFVIRGEGTTKVGDTELHWGPNDAFCVPNWSWHSHRNRSAANDALLFSVNDMPTLSALDLYREEPDVSIARSEWPPVPGNVARAAGPGR